MPDATFGTLLRELRSAAGLSQEELAERARLSPGAISALERGARRSPQHQTLGLLAEALVLDERARSRLEAAAAGARRRGARTAFADVPKPHNIPNVLTSFRGRDATAAELELLTRTRRLISLVGPGGVGKTRLAVESARALLASGRFPDGVWFVDLSPVSDGALVAGAIAHLAGVRESPADPLLDTLAAALRTKRVLLILDNCEHLVYECARVAERLLRDCEATAIVATTREALRAEGEVVVRVEPLAVSAGGETGPAFDVLVDRLADADFVRFSALSEADRAHARTICERLDGMPLALELAAARARDLPLAQIASGLDERFALLTTGTRTAEPRRSTLRGTIEWSYALLADAERRMFARLGLFADAFAPEAAAHVCGDDLPDARDALAGLIAKSMVTVIEDREGRLRYRLLETMRAFALDRLGDGEERAVYARRFVRYFLDAARAADARFGRMPNDAFLADVEPDLENFRAALEWTIGNGSDPRTGAELAGSLGWVYRQTTLFAEGARWCERALAADLRLDGGVEGRLHMALSFFYFNMGRLQAALEAAERATAVYSASGRTSDVSWALTQQTYCLYLLGRLDEAREVVARAVASARAQDDPLRLAAAVNALAVTIPLERAAERFGPLEEAIRAYRIAGDACAIVPTANLAETHYATGDFAAALAVGLDVVAMTRKNRDRSNLASALTNVAAYALTLGDVEQADAAAREALALVRALGKTLNAMVALQHLGDVAVRRGDAQRGARLAGASNRLYADFGLAREHTERSLYDRMRAALAADLGEDGLAGALAAGEGLSLDEALTEALAPD